MFYYIKVTAKSGKEIELNGKEDGPIKAYLKRVSVKIDTVEENVQNKASNVLNKVELELDINENTNQICKDFMDWSLSDSGDDIYRTVHIDIYNTSKVIRSFDLEEMFVEDCFEEYEKKDNKDNGLFTLKLIQQANKGDKFLHDVNQL